jgi:thioredoxin 1
MTDYRSTQPTRAEIDAMRGPVVVSFGTNWCGFCKGAEPLITEAFTEYPDIPHLQVEDGKGLALGRSFRVKLWPTLVFMRDGQEVSRLVRPDDAEAIANALAAIEMAPGKEQAIAPNS